MSVELWIVAGPSSAGKSRLLSDPRLTDITGLAPGAPVLFPADITPDREVEASAYLHYNLLRPARKLMKASRPLARALDFTIDHKWRLIAALDYPKRAITVRADRDVLLQRVARRRDIERGNPKKYPGEPLRAGRPR